MFKTDEIVLPTKEAAEAVLDAMKKLLDTYEAVYFADLLELCGIASTFSDNKVGWTNLTDVKVKPVEGGFILDLPPAETMKW